MGAGGPDGLQRDRGSQPTAVHRGVRHTGHGRHAVPAGLLGLLRRHPGEQMSPALCESAAGITRSCVEGPAAHRAQSSFLRFNVDFVFMVVKTCVCVSE